MPTIMVWNGYRFHFYSNEKGEPPHIPVSKSGCTAKFWLDEMALAYNDRFKHNEIRTIIEGLTQHRATLIAAWTAHHGH